MAASRRFVTRKDVKVERLPWGPHDWLARPDLVDTEELLLVRVRIPRGKGQTFHRHPGMEEIIYVLDGTAEQWVDRDVRILKAGEIAHIPRDVVHATFNAGLKSLVYLSILGPARFEGPAFVDVSGEEPWAGIREKAAAKTRRTAGAKTAGDGKAKRKKKTPRASEAPKTRARGGSRSAARTVRRGRRAKRERGGR